MFGKFIFPGTSREPGENDESTVQEPEENDEPTANYRQLRENCWRDRKIFLPTWKRTKIQTNTVPIEPQTCSLKKPLEMVSSELSANPVLITRTSCSWTKCSQVSPLLGEIKIYAHGVFCRKFNCIQFLLEAFFNTIGAFGSIQFPKWANFFIPVHYLKNGKFLVPRSSTSGGNKDMRPLSFLDEI